MTHRSYHIIHSYHKFYIAIFSHCQYNTITDTILTPIQEQLYNSKRYEFIGLVMLKDRGVPNGALKSLVAVEVEKTSRKNINYQSSQPLFSHYNLDFNVFKVLQNIILRPNPSQSENLYSIQCRSL